MNIFPLKFRAVDVGILFADDAGGFFKSDSGFLHRYVSSQLHVSDTQFLVRNGHAFQTTEDLAYTAFSYRWAHRLYQPGPLDYVILVPTLRCNLACGYCQVSRVNEDTPGFDWTPKVLQSVLEFLGSLPRRTLKVEFQGGEPLLALDALIRVRDFCRDHFDKVEFVVCTNLQSVSDEAWAFLADDDTFISTSLDANRATHLRQRTVTEAKTEEFLGNLRRAIEKFGNRKVSALLNRAGCAGDRLV